MKVARAQYDQIVAERDRLKLDLAKVRLEVTEALGKEAEVMKELHDMAQMMLIALASFSGILEMLETLATPEKAVELNLESMKKAIAGYKEQIEEKLRGEESDDKERSATA